MTIKNRLEALDCDHWLNRFDRMQERYLPDRSDRFEVIVNVIRSVRPGVRRVLDLGCGTGSLSKAILSAFPDCVLVGIDVDESILALAKKRLASFGRQVELLRHDLRQGEWVAASAGDFDAVVSATALHWLSAEHLTQLYQRLAQVIVSGGVFLNADHVGSECANLQAAWEQEKRQHFASTVTGGAGSWSDFWQAYAGALGIDVNQVGSGAVGQWEGVEDGMPLAWHFDRLREAGFSSPECFWRRAGDAIYGAMLRER
jgi:SAM-dependent methyltransferase